MKATKVIGLLVTISAVMLLFAGVVMAEPPSSGGLVMNEVLALTLTVLVVAGAFGAFALIGIVTFRRAEETALRIAGYVVAVFFGSLAVVVPLWMVFVFGAYESSEGNSDIFCRNFPNQQVAQAFYDVVRDMEPGYSWLDEDNDGVACEDGTSQEWAERHMVGP